MGRLLCSGKSSREWTTMPVTEVEQDMRIELRLPLSSRRLPT